ncbi:serine/threonine protein kinase [Pluralibacter gergoviae]|uniref:serine/threonine protein kinase n=1 Tax=Pluralibacter gergoviae TaxID=61647 RepID=UPI0006AC2117|nr:protein kinase [Pluralibacter gergoviae]EKV0932983.1 protein kinase [Pluralibacter gergoviae]EKV6248599.1 protein kinase [Pluralibacter gergoviae]ELD4273176.1 protein kinase [Pluralibacter gergoviae]ELD4278730.1 protein kinase [Pluralibacter gergoviae]ELD4318126.1 protein kinase [Pluralibacter gergoviae]
MTDHDNNRTVLNALPIGYRFNEFEIKEVIGGGGFGIVYRAWDHQLERTIAIKEFMPSSLAVRGDDMTLVLRSERFGKAFSAGLNSFIQEARLLARFNHPNLVHVLRFWVQNDTAYMGTLFYTGTTLTRLREQQPDLIDEAWIRRVLPMLFGAIKTIHDEGYLHRDISPDNIQIQENGLPVLLDLGSARRTIGNLSDETETMLRPGYAPLEQYTDDNESEQGAWTDIYAVGAVLHTLIAGSPPPVSVVRSIQDTYVPLAERQPAGYSMELLKAVDKALALHIQDRPQSIDEFAAMIEMPVSHINDVMAEKKPGTMLAVVEEEKPALTDWRRYKVPGMIAAGVLVGIIAGGMLFSGGGSDAPTADTAAATPATQPPATEAAPAQTPAVQPPAATQAPTETAAATQTPPPAQQEQAHAAVAAPPVALIYVRMHAGEKLTLNGEAQSVTPATSGFASLKLAPGHYQIVLQGSGGSRTQTLEIGKAGTWLINPAG